MSLGRASKIGWTTIGLYLLTTIVASILGIICIVMFRSKFTSETFEEDLETVVTLGCNSAGSFVTEGADGTLSCSSTSQSEEDILFLFDDVTGALVKASSGTASDISMSETIYTGIFTKLVTCTTFLSRSTTETLRRFASLPSFLGLLSEESCKSTILTRSESMVMRLFRELDKCFILLINWVILATPFAVF